MEDTKLQMAFAAIDKTLVSSIPEPTQDTYRNKDYVYWGVDNKYPQYLWDLFNDVTTLKTIVEGTSDFVCGDEARCNIDGFGVRMNRKGDTLSDLIKWIDRDYNIYGGFALQIVRSIKGDVAEIYYVDFRYLRTDRKNESFWYSEDFDKPYVRKTKAVLYPKFVPGGDAPSSIIYVKNINTLPYPIPRYSGAITDCEIERSVSKMHLNSLENGFMPSYILSFLNGVPSDEQKAEIEKNIQEKFCSVNNAGRVLLNFADGEANSTKVEKLSIEDFGERYKSCAERAQQQIYCAFQAIPQLFGCMRLSSATGFSQQEFEEAYKLYSSTVVRSQQRLIANAFDKIFGVNGSITIDTFKLGDNTNVD